MKSKLIELKKRNSTRVEKRYDIHTNGADNTYPTRMEIIIDSSPTAKSCAKAMAKFIIGGGFSAAIPDDFVVGETLSGSLTLSEVLKDVAYSIAYQSAFALHFNYNLLGQITSITPIPYKNCRYGVSDSEGYSGKIVVYDNWDYSKGRQIRKDEIDVFYVYNPKKEVILEQIESAGGIYKYNGQVLIVKMDNSCIYPLSPIDVAQDDADTEYQLQLYKNRITRKGFIGKKILMTNEFSDDDSREAFQKDLKNIQGFDSEGDILHFETEFTSDDKQKMIEIKNLDSDVKTDLFTNWESSISNNIRRCFNSIPPVLVDFVEGKLGNTSGEGFLMAQAFYNSQTAEERKIVSGTFKKIFSHFHLQINPTNDWSIKQLNLLGDGTSGEQKPAAQQQSEQQNPAAKSAGGGYN